MPMATVTPARKARNRHTGFQLSGMGSRGKSDMGQLLNMKYTAPTMQRAAQT